MSIKKIFFGVSIGANVLLLLVVFWGYPKLEYVTDRTLSYRIDLNLLKLEDEISYQRKNGWPEPTTVAILLRESFEGIENSLVVGTATKALSESDLKLLSEFRTFLSRYPKLSDTLNKDGLRLTSDTYIKEYEELGDKLLEVGFRKMAEKPGGSESASYSEYIEHILGLVEELMDGNKDQ